MKHYQRTEMFAASPAAVYAAITTVTGLSGWWTSSCHVGKEVGSISTFRFGSAYNRMRVDKLVPDEKVSWHCVDQHYESSGSSSKSNAWVGTSIEFRLIYIENGGTELRFDHKGLVPSMKSYRVWVSEWDEFIGQSLKSYLESGTGKPFTGKQVKMTLKPTTKKQMMTRKRAG